MQTLRLDTALVDEATSAHHVLGEKYLEAAEKYDSANSASVQAVDAPVKGMDRAPTKKIDEIVTDVIDQSKQILAAEAKQSQARFDTLRILLAAGALLAVALGSVVTFWLVRSITRPLNKAVKIAQCVAAGDLSAQVEVRGRDETAMLMQALKEMNASLANIVSDVRSGTDAISTASS